MTSSHKNDGSDIRNAMRLVVLVGLIISASILTGTWAGFNLDKHLQAEGTLTAAGMLTGLFTGLGLAIWLLLRASPPR